MPMIRAQEYSGGSCDPDKEDHVVSAVGRDHSSRSRFPLLSFLCRNTLHLRIRFMTRGYGSPGNIGKRG